MVDSGGMTGPNLGNYYYITISFCSVHTVVFLAELNSNETHTDDISNAYVASCTTEKMFFNAVPEFSSFGHSGHLLPIKTYLYGLKSYGDRLHSCLSYALPAFGFVPSMVRYGIWTSNEGN